MVQKGAVFAIKRLSKMSFRLPPESEVEKQLALLIIKVNKLFFGLPSAPETRASVFLVIGKKLQMCYRYGFEPGAADPPVFGFDQGLTGYAYTRLTRLYCNLGELTNLAATNPAQATGLFNMTAEQHLCVKSDRTWLWCVPIAHVATHGEWQTERAREVGSSPIEKQYFDSIATRRLGQPVYGILDVDTNAKLAADALLFGIVVDIMDVTADLLTQIFARSFSEGSSDVR